MRARCTERLPIIGERPQPVFLAFDGRRIDLPDGSVDRILSFHAFHHVPNPDAVLQEFGRLLKPGGIAGFVEPGPTHSRDPQSQFEMRAYRVVENDVDVHAIWRHARACGFADIKLAIHHGPPFHVSLEEFEDFLADGGGGARWVNATRAFLRHVRTFFLYREGVERVDSRSVDALACSIDATLAGPTTKVSRSSLRPRFETTATPCGSRRMRSTGAWPSACTFTTGRGSFSRSITNGNS